MPGRLNIILIFFILVIITKSLFAQSDKHLDSLETAIRQAEEGPHKADLMLEFLIYQYNSLGLHQDETYLEELKSIYRYSKKIGYLKGMADLTKRIGYSYVSRIDSSGNISMNQ